MIEILLLGVFCFGAGVLFTLGFKAIGTVRVETEPKLESCPDCGRELLPVFARDPETGKDHTRACIRCGTFVDLEAGVGQPVPWEHWE